MQRHRVSKRLGQRPARYGFLFAAAALVVSASVLRADEVWTFGDLKRIGGHEAKIVGSPRVSSRDGQPEVQFDGVHDGLFVSSIPLAGAKAFTIEVLFSPTEGGPPAQRFLHVQDANGRRALMEIRTDGKGGWWLDTFLRGGAPTDKGLTLIDPKRIHPTNRWYWVALRYDGTHMADFVNGTKELEGSIAYPPLGDGTISIGVRQNQVYWFEGRICEVRFHTRALADEELERVK